MRRVALVFSSTILALACSTSSPDTRTDGSSGQRPPGSGSGSSSQQTSVAGTSDLTFTPSFAGFATGSGTCPVCGGLGGDEPSGPASYQGLVVLLSDDPTIASFCDSDAAVGYQQDLKRYHYLSIEVISTDGAVGAGSYVVSNAPGDGDAGASSASVVLSRPVITDGSAAQLGWEQDDDPSGDVDLTSVSGVVTGTFTAAALQDFGSTTAGNLNGTFSASACPGLREIAFQGPCGGCPG